MNVVENVEHVIRKCAEFDLERNILRDKIYDLVLHTPVK